MERLNLPAVEMFHRTAELRLLDYQLSVVLVSLPKINQPIKKNIKRSFADEDLVNVIYRFFEKFNMLLPTMK